MIDLFLSAFSLDTLRDRDFFSLSPLVSILSGDLDLLLDFFLVLGDPSPVFTGEPLLDLLLDLARETLLDLDRLLERLRDLDFAGEPLRDLDLA